MRLARAEIVAVHATARTNRRCFLLGQDPLSGKNFDHRKRWIEDKLQLLAFYHGIDLLAFTFMFNHIHLVLRSRPPGTIPKSLGGGGRSAQNAKSVAK
jgi:hypothetical protein